MGTEDEVKILKRQVESLQNELKASMRREEQLQNPAGGGGSLKQRLKRTAVWRIVADPNSKMGKIARSPRTIYRIARNPNILKEKMQDEKSQGGGEKEEKALFVPIKFFFREDDTKRVNLVVDRFNDIELIKMAVELSNKEKAELRVVTCAESSVVMKYKRMVEKGEIPKAKEVSFYSSSDQSKKKDVFELEIGNRDVFITRAWKNG